MSHPQRPAIVVCRGPRACEQALLENVVQETEELGSAVLTHPVYLLVPSHSLRDHILSRLARQRPGFAGIGCLTLRGLAGDLLDRHGESPLPGSWLLPILVRRMARNQPPLRSSLDHLRDGYRSLIGTVTDLQEAGLDPAHAEAIDEVLAEEGRLVASVAAVQRSRSLVQVAVQVRQELERRGLGHVSSMLQRATELLRGAEDPPLPCSGFHVYGFADATGVATDLIEAALSRFGGTVYLDHPPDPADPSIPDPSFEFSRRFATRLTDIGTQTSDPPATPAPSEIQLIAALGGAAEVREVGWRVRSLLDDGVSPEEIGVVARRLESFGSEIRTHFDRLGIPFSAARFSGPLLPWGRQIRALLHLIQHREAARLERWLDARRTTESGVANFDLRLAFYGLGLSLIQDLAALRRDDVLAQESLPLPVRHGYADADDRDDGLRLTRRRVPTEALRQARNQASELCRMFDSWTGPQAWSGHRERLDSLLIHLGWTESTGLQQEVTKVVDRLSAGIPASVSLDYDELTQSLIDAFSGSGLDRFGGLGGGVQILDVTEARGRTFQHLFVLGMNRGVFPRSIREDPALPDELRRVLARQGHGVLPDLPLKRAGFAEERFLFAQLCSASPRVTLSWQAADDDNRELATSPLVERLSWSREPFRALSPLSEGVGADSSTRLRTGMESAIRAALRGSPRQIKAALAHAQPVDLSVPAAAVAAARWSVASELDRSPAEADRLGPYLGFVGEATDAADPRLAQALYITTLESFAVCPWRTFLEKLLRLEVLPDPVEILPGIDPFLIGQLVHRVLERLVETPQSAPASGFDEIRGSQPASFSWPDDERLLDLLNRAARSVARDQGIAWDGFPEILAEIARPYLIGARRLLALDPPGTGPVAVEMDAGLPIGRGETDHQLRFKIDRIDRAPDRLLLSDFKTGRRGVSQAKTRRTRDKHLLQAIRSGRLLQAAAYSRASGGHQDQGRYLFLHPDFRGAEDHRIVTIPADDVSAQSAFDQAVTSLDRAWQAGLFFPRLVEPEGDQEPNACEYCAVAEACVRGDSGLRGRLRSWTEERRPRDEVERILLDTWYLASDKEPA